MIDAALDSTLAASTSNPDTGLLGRSEPPDADTNSFLWGLWDLKERSKSILRDGPVYDTGPNGMGSTPPGRFMIVSGSYAKGFYYWYVNTTQGFVKDTIDVPEHVGWIYKASTERPGDYGNFIVQNEKRHLVRQWNYVSNTVTDLPENYRWASYAAEQDPGGSMAHMTWTAGPPLYFGGKMLEGPQGPTLLTPKMAGEIPYTPKTAYQKLMERVEGGGGRSRTLQSIEANAANQEAGALRLVEREAATMAMDPRYIVNEQGLTIHAEGQISGPHPGRKKGSLPEPVGGRVFGEHRGHLIPESGVDNPILVNVSENLISEARHSNLGPKKSFDLRASRIAAENPISVVITGHDPLRRPGETRPFAVSHWIEVDGVVVYGVTILNK